MANQIVVIETEPDKDWDPDAAGLSSPARRSLLLELARHPRTARLAIETLSQELALVVHVAESNGDPTIRIAAELLDGAW